jgi:hypothetical protein
LVNTDDVAAMAADLMALDFPIAAFLPFGHDGSPARPIRRCGRSK